MYYEEDEEDEEDEKVEQEAVEFAKENLKGVTTKANSKSNIIFSSEGGT